MGLKLRVGGKYRNGKGQIVGPLSRTADDEFSFVDKNGRTYTINGKWSMGDAVHLWDLIEEVSEEVPAKQMQVLLDGVWYDVGPESLREKPAKKKHRVVQYVNLYADGQVGNLYDSKAECERLSGGDPCEMREVVFEWESE